ncbi:heptaprenyl diphosphate synthase component 1 [Bacillus sp. JJ1521]|uniref:heptaprenyl diphosphate synthase component 1 n=1 Tax=Bacillus sp. JJ1521 TaxID=3122957 RepID=UPI002FFDC14E
MIDLHDIKEIVANLKERIEDKTRHSYLQRYMETPSIDEDKLLLLYSICEDLLLPQEQLTNYIVTTMLVQQALDTHETVPNRLAISDERMRGQQLAVLAGDYFSGLYYYLLAQASDINFIRVLAEGIKEVNEAKIYLYQMDHERTDKLFSGVAAVESAIFRKIVNRFQIEKWDEIVKNFLLLKRLLFERDQYLENGNSILIKTLKKIVSVQEQDQKMDVMYKFNMHLSHVSKRLEQSLESNPKINNLLLSRINELLLNGTTLSLKRSVEEG